MKIQTVALSAVLLTFLVAGVSGKTPDGGPPAEEDVCSELEGVAFGLCVSYCEATDCDGNPRASQRACDRLRSAWRRQTGLDELPCDCPPPLVFDADAGCGCDAALVDCPAGEEPDPFSCTCLPACFRTGCLGHLCADHEILTTCEFFEWYVCYEGATCERQPDGECDWTPTEELLHCLDENMQSLDGNMP
jgi:hypothetical protein